MHDITDHRDLSIDKPNRASINNEENQKTYRRILKTIENKRCGMEDNPVDVWCSLSVQYGRLSITHKKVEREPRKML